MNDTLSREDQYEVRRLAVVALRDEGYSLREIARGLGISHEWARKLLLRSVNT